MIYTGVGSRETPPDIIQIIERIACNCAGKGYTLRSGGADGADMAFEVGCDKANGKKEIYLPWKKFNNNSSELYKVSPEAFELAVQIHPAWSRLSFGAKKLHARNCYQVLGIDLKTPSDFLICWTSNGLMVGGTRTALVLAEKFEIPIYNLAIPSTYDSLVKLGYV